MGGLAGAASLCATRAAASSISAIRAVTGWETWLSTSTSNARDRIVHTSGNYVNPNGVVLAAGYAQLIDGSLDVAMNKDENGATVSGGTLAWTSTAATGLWNGGNSCSGWTSTASSLTNVGRTDLVASPAWSVATNADCSGVGPYLYCFALSP